MSWIDVTRPLGRAAEIYPGDPPVRFEPQATVQQDGYAVTRLHLGTHSGTHIDAPSHLLAGGTSVDRLPLEAMCGPGRLVVPAGDPLGVPALEALGLEGAQRVLFRTCTPDGPYSLAEDAAAWLVARGVRLVGWDRISVDPVGSEELPAHRRLLAAGTVLAEGLDLLDLEPGPYEVVALPLRLEGLDGSPARILVRRT